MKTLRALVFTLLVVAPLALAAHAYGADDDSDGVANFEDNCSAVPNASQFDADGDAFGNPCDCDYDQNNTCGFNDFSLFLQCFGLATGPGVGPPDSFPGAGDGDPDCEESDQDENGTVGFGDFTLFLDGFGGAPGPSGPLTPLGSRTFSTDAEGFFSSTFLGGASSLGNLVGTITFEAGLRDVDGIADITTPGGPYYFFVDILGGTQGRLCRRITSCIGEIDCDGGTNVDVTAELDSLATGAMDPCEGVGVGSGNSTIVSTGVNPTDSGSGAVLLTCMGSTAAVLAGTDCTAVAYGPDSPVVLTSGTNTATMLNECPNILGPATISKTGENFSCADWTTENGPGQLIFTELSEEPSSLITGDTANAGIYDD